MSGWFTESIVEDAALGWLEDLGYAVLYGPDISPDGDTLTSRLSRLERPSYSDVILADRLRNALARLNPQLPAEALDDAFRKLKRAEGMPLTERNRAVHRMLVKSVPVEYRADGSTVGGLMRSVDFDNADNNDWLAANRCTGVEDWRARRP